jgi:hypothetical protein
VQGTVLSHVYSIKGAVYSSQDATVIPVAKAADTKRIRQVNAGLSLYEMFFRPNKELLRSFGSSMDFYGLTAQFSTIGSQEPLR